MRQVGTLDAKQDALAFQDWLLARGTRATVDAEDGRWVIWVHEEDQIGRAREEFAEFVREPRSERYREAVEAGERVRREQERLQRRHDVQQAVRERRSRGRVPFVTYALIAVSVAVTVLSTSWTKLPVMGDVHDPIVDALSIASYRIEGGRISWFGLDDIVESWQVWRLATPMFLHFSVLHVLFNMLWLRDLGSTIEDRHGPFLYLPLVLLIAVASNLGQYGVNRWMEDGGPNFGGMSGVVYGLFGYVWIRARLEPESDVWFMPSNVVFWMIGWFALCLTGVAGPVANSAHGVGLAAGALSGLAASWVRRRTVGGTGLADDSAGRTGRDRPTRVEDGDRPS